MTLAQVVRELREAGCVFAEEEAALLAEAASGPVELADLVARRVAGLPLEQVLGWAEFCGLRVRVEPGVFVPRRRTGLMVEEAVALGAPGAVVLDLCCGSGAVGLAVASRLGDIELHAADVEADAVGCARRNLVAVGGCVHEGDLYDALPERLRGRVDLLVANAPYVPTDAVPLMPPEARLHEPLVTLDGGADGLDVVRRVVSGAGEWLAPGGHLLVEAGTGQLPLVRDLFSGAGLRPRVVTSEDLGGTVVVGRLA